MSDTGQEAENIFISIGGGLIGMTLVYALATDILGLARPSSRTLYLFALLCLSVAVVIRFVRLRGSGVKILLGRLPPMQPGDANKYLRWLMAAVALNAYSIYEIAVHDGDVFIPTCAISLILMIVLAAGLFRVHT